MGTFCSCEDHARDRSVKMDMDDPLSMDHSPRAGNKRPPRQHTPIQDPWDRSALASVVPTTTEGNDATDSPKSNNGEISNNVESPSSSNSDESSAPRSETNVTTGNESGMDEPRDRSSSNNLVQPHLVDKVSKKEMEKMAKEYETAILRMGTQAALAKEQTELKREQQQISVEFGSQGLPSPTQLAPCTTTAAWTSTSDVTSLTRNVS